MKKPICKKMTLQSVLEIMVHGKSAIRVHLLICCQKYKKNVKEEMFSIKMQMMNQSNG